MDRDSFVFYASFHKALSGLPPDDYKQTLVAVCEYALFGKEPDLQGIPFMAFELIRPQIDANNKKYQNGIKGAEYGKLGGRPKKKPSGVMEENPIGVTDETPNVNVNENVNVNVNDINKGKPAKHRYGEYKNVLLTDAEMEKLKKEFPDDWQDRIEQLSDYMKSKGATYKDHLATIRNWNRRDKKKAAERVKKGANYTQREFDYDAALASGLIGGKR